MPYIQAGDVKLFYQEEGQGDALVLLHGLASHADHSWRATSWVARLRREFRILLPDCRGHGRSDKSYDPDFYSLERLNADTVALLDHLEIRRAGVLGYSAGGWQGLGLALYHPERISALVAAGTGLGVTKPIDRGRVDALAKSITSGLADDPAAQQGRIFREMCRRTGNDPEVIAAFLRRPRGGMDQTRLARLAVPVLLVVGTEDPLSRDIEEFKALIPGANLVTLPGRTHMNAPLDDLFKDAAVRFFQAHRA